MRLRSLIVIAAAMLPFAAAAHEGQPCGELSPDAAIEEALWQPADQDTDFAESPDDVARLRAIEAASPAPPTPRGPAIQACRQPQGALSGILVFCNGGHGWTADDADSTPNDGDFGWYTQRGLTNGMVEDFGNLDQLNMFATFAFNAGATVIPMRPLGEQSIERVVDNDDAEVTFTGAWSNSSSTIFYGTAGDPVPYRFASIAASETATARYTPNLPSAGYYPVYTWVRAGSDRTNQLYRIVMSGGATEVRVNHRRVGNGWVWLGNYYFDAGTSGYVEVSNLQQAGETGTLVFADAIRFGNGMGDIARPPVGVSGFPREEESARYWAQSMIGQGGDTSVYTSGGDDYDDSIVTPPRMSRAMNRETEGTFYDRIHLSFHTNASTGTARGAIALINTVPTPDQATFAAMVNAEVEADVEALDSGVEFAGDWIDSSGDTLTGGYGEISNNSLSGEMCATILEVGFHDSPSDADFLREPKFRHAVARSSVKAIIRFLNTQGGGVVPLEFAPGTPTHLRAMNAGAGSVTLTWSAPASLSAVGDPPTGYVVYRSGNGLGFGEPIDITGAGTTSTTINGLNPGQTYYFQVAAVNGGGESPASETVAARVGTADVLLVNGYDRYDSGNSPGRVVASNLGSTAAGGGGFLMIRGLRMNSFDYVAEYGPALATANAVFDTTSNDAVLSAAVSLSGYQAVVWISGNESTVDESFSIGEQMLLEDYLDAGGNLFASGSEIAWDLDRFTGPTAADRAFLNNYLGVDYAVDDADTFAVTANAGAGLIFDGVSPISFSHDDGARYWVFYPDRVTPANGNALANMSYVGGFGSGSAGVQHNAGTFRTVFLGFPFETIVTPSARADVMTRVMGYFGLGASGVGDWTEF